MTWAYLAGFTDADGCITREISKKTYSYARVRWAQKESQSEVLHEIAMFLRCRGIKVSLRNFAVSTKGHKYPQVELGITNAEDSRQVIEAMLPYLIVKRIRAIEALAVLNLVKQAKDRYGWKYRKGLLGEQSYVSGVQEIRS